LCARTEKPNLSESADKFLYQSIRILTTDLQKKVSSKKKQRVPFSPHSSDGKVDESYTFSCWCHYLVPLLKKGRSYRPAILPIKLRSF
jgi:hypothetical protein